MQRKAVFRNVAIVSLFFIFICFNSYPALAKCVFEKIGNTYSIICTGTTKGGLFCTGGRDDILVYDNAEITHDVSYDGATDETIIGIDGGNGNDIVSNFGTITVRASSAVTTSNGNAAALRTGQLNIKDDFATSASQRTSKKKNDGPRVSGISAAGIEAGNGKDVIINTGSVSVEATATVDVQNETWDFAGKDRTDVSMDTNSEATGIGSEGNGKDTITNAGELVVISTAKTQAGTIDGTLGGSAQNKSTMSSTAVATGIDGGNGKDDEGVITNNGKLTVGSLAYTASDDYNLTFLGPSEVNSRMTATAISEGIKGGNGKDIIDNQGEIVVGAAATTKSLGVALAFEGVAKTTETVGFPDSAISSAVGMSGGNGKDTITSSGTVTVSATSYTHSEEVAVAVQGTAAVDSSLIARGDATGFDGGDAKDVLKNAGTLNVTAGAVTYGLAADINTVDVTQSNLTRTAESSVTGIDGGGADDEISNTGTLTATATSSVESWTVDVNAVDIGIVDSSITVDSTATGMTGGEGTEELFNSGTLTAGAGSSVQAWTFELTGTDLALGNASTTADAVATGIDASIDDEVVTNTGSVTATASSDVQTGGITIALVDLTILQDIGKLVGVDEEYLKPGNASTTLTSSATGIRMDPAGDEVKHHRDDTIVNHGDVTALATTEALSIGVGIGAEGIPAGLLDALQVWEDSNLADASTSLISTATGIDAGGGDNSIDHDGIILAGAQSTVTGVNASLSLPLLEPVVTFPSPAFALAKEGSESISSATGILTGDGVDSIVSAGEVKAVADANATAVSTAIIFQGVLDSIDKWDIAFGRADATTTSDATAKGIVVGGGDDTVVNSAGVTVDADALSVGAAVSFSFQHKVEKALDIEGTLADTDTSANADATAIELGDGNDTVDNSGTLTASADSNDVAVSLSGAVVNEGEKSMIVNTAIARTDAEARSASAGIDVGDGDDVMRNTGSMDIDADSTAVGAGISLTVQGTNSKGAGLMASLVNTTTTSISDAVAIDGGTGTSLIENLGRLEVDATSNSVAASVGVTFEKQKTKALGFSLANARSRSGSSALGILTDDGYDTVLNAGDIATDSTAVGVAASISVVRKGVAGAVTLDPLSFDSGNVTTSRAAAITTNAGDDEIFSDAALTASADSTSPSVGVAVSAKGISAAITTSEAHSDATGIEAGTGNDTVQSAGEITTDATSTAVAVSVAVSNKGLAIAGDMIWDGGTKATATAKGIDTGSGDDEVDNAAIIDAESIAIAPSIGVAVDGKGLSGAISTATSEAEAVGIDTGEGNEQIANTGNVTASAVSNADSINVAISGKGVAATLNDVWDGGVEATASAKGIDAGEGDEAIINSGTLDTDATAVTASVGVSVAKEGIAVSVGTSTAEAESTGIEAGEGTETITNLGGITGDAVATAVGVSVSVTGKGIAGAADAVWDGGTTALATTKGINAGDDNDIIDNYGNIDIDATAIAPSIGVSVTGKGISGAVTTATSHAETIGLDAGEGDDWIYNTGNITAGAVSNADAITVSIAGKGIAASANDVWDGGAESTAIARGIDVGGGSNTIGNSGAIDADATAVTASIGVSVVGKGIAAAASTSTAEAESVGIDLGDLTDYFANTGPTITADATAVAAAVNVAVSGKGIAAALDAVWDGGTTAEATAKGIEAGFVDNIVSNTAAITTDAVSVAPSVGVSVSGQGISAAVTTATSTAESFGIDTDGGNDVIHNKGVIDADALSNADAITVAVSGKGIAGAADAVWDGGTTATAFAGGIDTGTGSNSVLNEAAVDADAEAVTVAVGVSVVGQGIGVSASTSTAVADSAAIALGDGEGTVHNKSQLTTDADSTAVTVNVAVAGQGIAGSADAVWDGGTKSTATTSGIRTGASADSVKNEAKIDSEVDAVTVSAGISVVGTGIGLATSTSTATGMTTGIETGAGHDVIDNTGVIETEADGTAVTATVSVAGTGIAGSADAVWDGGTKASATSHGIDAGAGDNSVRNTAKIDAESDATTVAAAISVAGTGIGISTSTSTAEAGAIGITSGNETDIIDNTGEIFADAASTAVSAQVSVAGTGIAAASDAVWDGGTTARATAAGLDSAGGSDSIFNMAKIDAETDATTVSAAVSVAGTGVGISMSKSTADAETLGISSGSGSDTVMNTQEIIADASSTAVSASVSITGLGISGAGGSVWDGGTKGYATAKAIDAGSEGDVIENSGRLAAESSTTSTSVGVAITGKGVAFTTATSTAEADAVAIDSGEGDDAIKNTAAITADAESDAVTVQVAVAGLGLAGAADSVWDNGTTSTASASGIHGAGGKDDIWNEGTIISTSEADTTTVAVSATLAGVAATAATSHAETEADAIDGGLGDDTIVNKADLTAEAESDATTVAVTIVGAGVALAADSVWDNGTTSLATARGIYGDAGNDDICSEGNISATSEADSVSVAVSMTLAGVAGTVATSTASTESSAFDGGDGDDSIVSTGTLTSSAISNADTVTVSIAGVGAALAADSVWDGGTTATATARGMYGGSGDDMIQSDGIIAAWADAETDSTAITATLAGVAGTVVSSTAVADAAGIEGGKGQDTIESLKTVNSTAIADAASVQVSISGIGASISADSAWDGGTTAAARARGLAGGDDNDTLVSRAAINAASSATSDSTAVAVSLAGIASTTAVSTSTSAATGIDGGTGDDAIESTGAITTAASADATALSVSIAGIGMAAGDNPFWDHTTTATAIAQGMSGGEGGDTMINRQSILSTVNADAEATEVSVTLAGVTFGDTATAALGIGTGMSGGGGRDMIVNEGAILVGAVPETDGLMARAEVDSVGVALVGAAFGDASATASVVSKGIDGGDGDDTVSNSEAISVFATSAADVAATTVGILGYAGQEANAVAIADATGIDGGSGNDTVVSTATLDSFSTTMVSLDSAAFTFAGAADAKGSTTAVTRATGLSGGTGEDGIRSEATITSTAMSTLTTEGNTTAVFGSAGSEMTSGAVTVSSGIDGGTDDDIIENIAMIDVDSTASLLMSVSNFTLGGAVSQDSTLAASIHSTGITGGAGSDSVLSSGEIDVDATALLISGGSTTTVFGSASGKASSGALTTAAGIDGASGNDIIESTSLMDISSTASLTMTGSAFTLGGGASNQSKLAASTHSTGIAGGMGSDSILNSGDILVSADAELGSQVGATAVFGGATSEATSGALTTATGIDGGNEDDIIESGSLIDVSSTALLTLNSTTFTFAGAGASAGTLAASTHSRGIGGGTGSDSILAGGILSVNATSTLNSTVNASTIFGSAESTATSGALTTAVGIDGGTDGDIIESLALIDVTSAATLTLSSSSFTFAGSASSDGAMVASTHSSGIAGGSGSDSMLTGGSIAVNATSTLNSSVNATAIFGSASASATSGAVTTTAGIDGGAGDDIIDSSTAIGVNSLSSISMNSSSYTFGGTSAADGALTATTRSSGISGGSGSDTIRSTGAILVYSTSMLTAVGDSKATFGSAEANTSTTSDTDAIGIDGGGDGDFIENLSDIDVRSKTYVTSNRSSFVFGGGASTDTVLTARANATGLKGGSGVDMISNEGDVSVRTNSTMVASGGTSATFGDTETDGKVTAEAAAKGIDAKGGDDTVMNTGRLRVVVDVSALSVNDSDAGLFFYDGGTRSHAGATFEAYGIDAWQDEIVPLTEETGNGDIIVNDGEILISINGSATANATADGGDVAWFTGGDASTTAVSGLSSKAYGVRADSDRAVVLNNGLLDVVAAPEAATYSAPTGGAFSTDADGYGWAISAGVSEAYGILTSGQEQWIENNGEINVTSAPDILAEINADGSTHGGSGDADAFGLSHATATVFGIGTAIGESHVLNTGILTVMAGPEGILLSDANGEGADGDGRTGSWDYPMDARATAVATGILTGAGINEVDNRGTVDVYANAYAYVYGNADGDTGGDVYTILNSLANATATGIQTGPGSNILDNSGLLRVEASAYAKSWGRADRYTGDAVSHSYSPATATSYGVLAGSGNSLFSFGNMGDVEVISSAFSDTLAHGDVDSYAYAHAFGNAYGVSVADNNALVLVDNLGSMTVTSSSMAYVQDDEPDMQAQATDKAYGIKVGNGNTTTIINTGTMNISSYASSFFAPWSNDWRSAHTSNATAVGISVGDGATTILNDGQIYLDANADNQPKDYSFKRVLNGYHGAAGWANGIQTGSAGDTIILGENSMITGGGRGHTVSAAGDAKASVLGVNAGHGTNIIENYGLIEMEAEATADVFIFSILGSIGLPAYANAQITGINSGEHGDDIKNYGDITVSSTANAWTDITPGSSAGQVAVSTAYGINAGDGNNTVGNYGTIIVSASASAGAGSAGGGSTDATAVGIRTGSGDDTIINEGSIHTSYSRYQTPSSVWQGPGVAIDSGAGNDQVTLGDGSSVYGNVYLGSGNDGLTVIGTAEMTGVADGGSDVDTLTLDGATNFDGGSAINFESMVQDGSGTVVVTNMPAMENLQVNQGTLQIDGDYRLADNGSIQTHIKGDGTYGQLEITETAQLDGTLSVVKGAGLYHNGTTYRVVKAKSISTESGFDDVVLPKATPLLSFDLERKDTLFEVKANAESFTTVATNSVENRIAEYLDNIAHGATGDLSDVLGEFQSLPLSEFDTAFASLSPAQYDSTTRTTHTVTRQYTETLLKRLHSIQSSGESSVTAPRVQLSSGRETHFIAYNGSDASILKLNSPDEEEQARWGAWLDVFGQWGNQDEDDGFTGYGYSVYGTTLGIDRMWEERFIAGISIGYSGTDIDIDRNLGDGEISTIYGSLYGSYYGKRGYIDAVLSYGGQNYDTKRRITIGPVSRTAESEHDGDMYSAFAEGGYNIDLHAWVLQPFASLLYINLDEEKFTEKGAGALNMAVDARKTESLVSELGLRFSHVSKLDSGLLVPEISAAWSYDYDIDDRIITASFAGAPDSAFSMEGQDVEQSGAVLGVGISLLKNGGLNTSLKYRGEFRNNYNAHGVIGELRFEF